MFEYNIPFVSALQDCLKRCWIKSLDCEDACTVETLRPNLFVCNELCDAESNVCVDKCIESALESE